MTPHADVLHDPARAFMPYPAVPVPRAATGPLAGLGFGVKDLFHIHGYPTSGGQPLLLALNAAQADPHVAAMVITHGTDTIEETAFLPKKRIK